MIIEYTRIRENATPPTRGNPSDAGLDVFFNPEDGNSVTLTPGSSERFQTGLRFGVPHGYMLEVKNRSSVAAKRSLIVGACVVDSGYDGEVFINLQNIGQSVQYIQPGQKIAQGVFVRIEKPELWEISEDNVYGVSTSRGDGGFGSTGV